MGALSRPWPRTKARGRLAVGRDGRTHSPELEAELIRGLIEGGINVLRIGVGPSPMLYFAVATLGVQGGIQVTGSHNPPEYNGFKMLLNGRSVFGAGNPEPRPPRCRRRLDRRPGLTSSKSTFSTLTSTGWCRTSRAASSASAGMRATAPAAWRSRSSSPSCRASIMPSTPGSTGRFRAIIRIPTVEANLADLKALVAEKKLDFGIAFDGDADRIGAVDAQGRVVWGDQLLMILAEPVLKDQPGATIIADVKASQILFDHIAKIGGTPLMWKTGHSLIKSKMKETGAPLAGEMSGHIFFKHRWYGFDDALYAAVRLIEAVAQSGKSLTEIMDEMPKSTATPEMRFPVDESRKFAVVAEVLHRLSSNGARVDSTDGARVMTDDGWWLLRASNTQDVLVARAEARDEDGLSRLMMQIDEQLALSGVERTESAGH